MKTFRPEPRPVLRHRAIRVSRAAEPVRDGDTRASRVLGAALCEPHRDVVTLRVGEALLGPWSVDLPAPAGLADACDRRPWVLRSPAVSVSLSGLVVLARGVWRAGSAVARVRRAAMGVAIAAAAVVIGGYALLSAPTPRPIYEIGPDPDVSPPLVAVAPDAVAAAVEPPVAQGEPSRVPGAGR
jgi:hypothetical protein